MRHSRTRHAVAAASAAALILSGCGAPDEGGQQAAPADASAPSAAGETPTHLDFTASTVDGGEVEGASYEGSPVVLWFWAPWCTICRGEAAGIAEAAERYEGEVEFVGVAGLGEVEAMREFVESTGTEGITHIVDEDGSIWSGFGVAGQPAFSFLSPEGAFDTHPGTLSETDLQARIDELSG